MMTRIEELESLEKADLPQTVDGLQDLCGRQIRELISSYEHIDYLTNRLYGRKSERYVSDDQLPLPMEIPKVEELEAVELPEEKEAVSYERRKSRKEKYHSLPVVEDDLYPEEEELNCSCCGERKKEVLTEESTQLHFRPYEALKRKVIKHIFKCEHGCEAGLTSPKPEPHIIDRCLATPELLAHVVTSKFVDYQPLNRVGDIFRRHGVDIAETTLLGWVNQFGEAITSVVSCLKAGVLRSRLVGTDDTTVRVLKCQSGKNPKTEWQGAFTGRFWQYQSLEGWTVFEYTPDRTAKGPTEFFENYTGYLQADDYSGYNESCRNGAIRVGCWGHARRYFFELPEKHKYRDHGLRYIGLLYQVERQIKTKSKQLLLEGKSISEEEVVSIRQKQAAPIFNEFSDWLKERAASSLPKSNFAEAANYVLSNQEALTRYLSFGFIQIDNTWVERGMRRIAIGRKNWLFCGNNDTAQNAAKIITLVANCISANINPYEYFVYLIKRYSRTLARDTYCLTPWGYRDFLAKG